MNYLLYILDGIHSCHRKIKRRYQLYKMKTYKYKYSIGDTVICKCRSFWLDLSIDPDNEDRCYNKPCLILSIIEPIEIPIPQYRVLIGDRKMVLAEMWMEPISPL